MIPTPICATTPFPSADKGVEYPRLSRKQQIELSDRWQQQGDIDARNQLVASAMPWLYNRCQDITGNTTTPDEFQQVVLEVIGAMKDFDARKGAITTWVTKRVKWVIKRLRRWNSSIVKRPQNPPAKHVEADANAAKSVSLDMLVPAAVEDALPKCLPPDYDGSEELAWLLREIDYLPERLGAVIRGRLAGETLKELGKVLGVTRERIRQMEDEAIDALRYRMPLGEWEEMKKRAA